MSATVRGNFIDGQWIVGTETFDSINPSDTSDCVGNFSIATISDVESAISAARGAFSEWSYSGLEHRKSILDAIGAELIARSDEIGRLISREEGKTVPEGVGEVARCPPWTLAPPYPNPPPPGGREE